MYRIIFDARKGTWLIQMSRWGFLWQSVRSGEEARIFVDYDSAETFVEKVGLAAVYRNYHDAPEAFIVHKAWQ